MTLKKTIWIPAVIYLVLVLASPSKAAQAATDALLLWFAQVLPTLMPCFIGALLLEKSGVTQLGQNRPLALTQRLFGMNAQALALLAVCFCAGFPTGAKVICEQESKGALTRAQARTMLTACSVVSPGFILGSLGAMTLGQPRLGAAILAAHWLGALLCAVLFAEKDGRTPQNAAQMPTASFSELLCQAIGQSSGAMLSVAAAMAFFSVLIRFLPQRFFLLSAILEMTCGCSYLGALPLPTAVKTVALCAAVSFGGLCLGMQAMTYAGHLLPAGSYFLRKAVHCVISALLLAPLLFWG